MGGRTSMICSLMDPELIDKLVIVDSSPIQPMVVSRMPTMNAILQILKSADLSASQSRKDVEEHLSSVVKEPFIRQWLLMSLYRDREDEDWKWRFNVDHILANFDNILTLMPDPPGPNKFYSKPTLFIGGEKSAHIPKNSHDEIRKKYFPKAEFVYVKDAGHWVQMDNPPEFTRILFDFLGKE